MQTSNVHLALRNAASHRRQSNSECNLPKGSTTRGREDCGLQARDEEYLGHPTISRFPPRKEVKDTGKYGIRGRLCYPRGSIE